MDSILVKKGLKELLEYIPVELAPMGWSFSEKQPEDAFTFEINKRNSMFNHIKSISRGKKLYFSSNRVGCGAGNCYLGFNNPENMEQRITALPKGMPAHREIPVFKADHPFLFVIQDTLTKSIIFLGRILNPKG